MCLSWEGKNRWLGTAGQCLSTLSRSTKARHVSQCFKCFQHGLVLNFDFESSFIKTRKLSPPFCTHYIVLTANTTLYMNVSCMCTVHAHAHTCPLWHSWPGHKLNILLYRLTINNPANQYSGSISFQHDFQSAVSNFLSWRITVFGRRYLCLCFGAGKLMELEYWLKEKKENWRYFMTVISFFLTLVCFHFNVNG